MSISTEHLKNIDDFTLESLLFSERKQISKRGIITTDNLIFEYKKALTLLLKSTLVYPLVESIMGYYWNQILWDIKYRVHKCIYTWNIFNGLEINPSDNIRMFMGSNCEKYSINGSRIFLIGNNIPDIWVRIELSKDLILGIDFSKYYVSCQIKQITAVNWEYVIKTK